METLEEIVKRLMEVSPAIWATLIKQVYSDAFFLLLAGIIPCPIAYKLAVWARDNIENEDVIALFVGLTALGLIVMSIGFTFSGLQRFINPEFYAINYILQALP